MPPDMYSAFARSGMFGYCTKHSITNKGLKHFINYGTQWRDELKHRYFPFQNVPDPWKRSDALLPPGGVTWVRLAQKDNLMSCEEDHGWIALYFIKPNRFFFPNPNELALIGPIPLKLKKMMEIEGLPQRIKIYPSPHNEFAMVMCYECPSDIDFSNPKSTEIVYNTSYDLVTKLLNEISVLTDQPLPISQTFIIGIPSGVIYFRFSRPPRTVNFSPKEDTYPFCPFPALSDANALYREAISSNNPFHQFLTFWKVYENISFIRSQWRKDFKRNDERYTKEIIPDIPEFKKFEGISFDEGKKKLYKPFRVAIAHGRVKGGVPRTLAKSSDINEVIVHLPIIRYIARIALLNMRYNLAKHNNIEFEFEQ